MKLNSQLIQMVMIEIEKENKLKKQNKTRGNQANP